MMMGEPEDPSRVADRESVPRTSSSSSFLPLHLAANSLFLKVGKLKIYSPVPAKAQP